MPLKDRQLSESKSVSPCGFRIQFIQVLEFDFIWIDIASDPASAAKSGARINDRNTDPGAIKKDTTGSNQKACRKNSAFSGPRVI